MTEHPLFRMWQDRLDLEMARDRELAQRRAVREEELAAWYEAWHAYKARTVAAHVPAPKPRWWNVPGWALWLIRLHSPGRPN